MRIEDRIKKNRIEIEKLKARRAKIEASIRAIDRKRFEHQKLILGKSIQRALERGETVMITDVREWLGRQNLSLSEKQAWDLDQAEKPRPTRVDECSEHEANPQAQAQKYVRSTPGADMASSRRPRWPANVAIK